MAAFDIFGAHTTPHTTQPRAAAISSRCMTSHSSNKRTRQTGENAGEEDQLCDVGKAELPLVLFGLPIWRLPRRLLVLGSIAGTLAFYIVHGFLQEWLFSEPGFVFSLFVTQMQFLMFATFSRLDMSYQR
jgi:hypothetical protein